MKEICLASYLKLLNFGLKALENYRPENYNKPGWNNILVV
jgi:hypothetical protein